MRIRVLGCSGGIGGSLRTTAFLVDDDILVDAGTGVGDLPLESLAKIDHIFVSHSHLDHVTSIPFLVDTVCWMRGSPIVVYGIKDTLDILRAHLFNWKVWPDFTQIPDGDNPFMVYREIERGRDAWTSAAGGASPPSRPTTRCPRWGIFSTAGGRASPTPATRRRTPASGRW